ncbi:MAG: hypothetical protein AAGB23_05975 [Pseudomonadota bacterium]
MEQALVLASVVLGVAIAFELEHLNKVVRAKNVKWHWAQPLFAAFVLLAILAFWWGAVNWTMTRDESDAFSLAEFLPIMIEMILLALLAAVSFPDSIPEEGLDLADYYQENRAYQWTLFAGYFAVVHLTFAVSTALDAHSIKDMWVVVPDTIFLVLFAAMIFVRKWWQVAVGFAVLSVVPFAWANFTLG